MSVNLNSVLVGGTACCNSSATALSDIDDEEITSNGLNLVEPQPYKDSATIPSDNCEKS